MILKAGLYMSWLHAEFTLRLQETQRSLRITKRHMRNQRWKSGPISAASPQDKYVKHRRLQDVRFRDCMRLHSCALKMCHDLCFSKQNWRHPHKQLQSDWHFSLYISKSVCCGDFQCQCEFSYLTLVMCHLLIDSVKTSAFSHWLSSVHRWLTGHILLSYEAQFGPDLKCQTSWVVSKVLSIKKKKN